MPTDQQISDAIGQALKHFRKEKEMSQLTLAEESGIHRTMIEKIETSKRKPTFHTLHKICSALDIPVHQFSQKVEEILS